MKVWLYQANPEEYNLSETVPTLIGKRVGWRTIRYRDKMGRGDRILFWQTGEHAGIYALGELIRLPYPDTAASASEETQKWLIDVRYTSLLEHPVLKTDLVRHPTFQHLSVLLLPFQANPFPVKKAEWGAIRHLVGSGSDVQEPVAREAVAAAEQARATSQGLSVSPAVRKTIENFAMNKAKAHFKKAGYTVRDVSRHKSYDLHCERKGEVLYVEVKGTRTAGDEILLTRGEVRLARERTPHTALFVLHSVRVVENGGKPVAKAGQVRILQPWNPDERMLLALAYSYELPQE